MGHINVADIKAKDLAFKGGPQFDSDAIMLAQLYEDRSRHLTQGHLQKRGLGRPDENLPLETSMLKRIVDSISTVWRVPPVRRLWKNGRALTGDGRSMAALDIVVSAMQYDVAWSYVDKRRNLFNTIALAFLPSDPHGAITPRVFEPYNLFRDPNVMAQDLIAEDAAFLLQLRATWRTYPSGGLGESASTGTGLPFASPRHEANDNLYMAFMHEDDGTWRAWVVNEAGDLPIDIEQPYGDDGLLPWGDVLPVQLVYSEAPMGRAYVPINQSRVAYALAVNGRLNDLDYLTEQQAHSTIHLATQDPTRTPTETGPGTMLVGDVNDRATVLSPSPKLTESGDVLDQVLRCWALSEALPGDEYRDGRQVLTGAALKIREKELNARRAGQVPLAQRDERRAYAIVSAVHNAYAEQWGLPDLDQDAELRAHMGAPVIPTDRRELQQFYAYQIAIGCASAIDYLQELHGVTRCEAIELWERIQDDRGVYPIITGPDFFVGQGGTPQEPAPALDTQGRPARALPAPTQNPAQIVEGERPPGVSASPTPGAFNPRLGRASEGASTLDAMGSRRAA